jgi:hypothetical protein
LGRKPGFEFKNAATVEASVVPTDLDIAWAAGFLEGEGSFSLTSPKKRKTLPPYRTVRVTCRQMIREPLDHLQKLFGGTICLVQQPKNPLAKNKPIWDWSTSGARARGIMERLFPLMTSKRREQITHALTNDMAGGRRPQSDVA